MSNAMSGWRYPRALREVYGSRWFRSYGYLLAGVWIIGKLASVSAALMFGFSPFTFRPGIELLALAWESLVLVVAVRRRGEHLLLANLGLTTFDVLLPFVILHVILSGALSLVPR